MKFLTFLALFGAMTKGHEQVLSNVPNPLAPVQTRLSKKVLEKLFHSHDQEILDTFKDTIVDLPAGLSIKGELNFSFNPTNGIKKENFDFNLFLEN